MLKFAFLVNNPGHSPEDYSVVYENSESYSIIAGTDNMDDAVDYVANLAADGFSLIDLCGDFDDAVTAKMRTVAGPDVQIRHADYFESELPKVEAIEVFDKYGIVVMMDGVTDPAEVSVSCDELETHVIFVSSQEQANAAAKKLADWGAKDIELCSYFNAERTQPVIDAVEGRVPVGSAGL